jgi:hypothetical protein
MGDTAGRLNSMLGGFKFATRIPLISKRKGRILRTDVALS